MNPKDLERKNYYRTFRRNIIVIVIFVSYFPLIVVSSGILFQVHRIYREKVRVHLETLVKKHKQNIDHFLQERQNNISFLADAYPYEYLSDSANLAQLLKKLRGLYGHVFSDIGVVGADGRQVSYAGPFPLESARYDDAEWFHAAIQNEFYTSDVFKGLRDLPHFIVTVGKETDGQPWVLRATVDFLAFNDVVENITVGQTGFAHIINRVGALQTRTTGRPVPEVHAYLKLFQHPSQAGKDDIRFGTRKDEHGDDLIYVAGMLKDNQWALIFQQDKKDAFRDFYRTRNIIFLAFGLGGIAIATMAMVLSGRMVDRMVATDREKDLMNKQIVESGHLASLGELAAGIAHEINNPVAIMVEEAGWIEDLLEDKSLNKSENLDEIIRSLTQIRNQGIRARDITHKLLSFARHSDSRMDRLDVNELIRDIVSLSAQQAKYNNVDIKISLMDSLPTIWGSQTELQQVLINLINNAIAAMDKQGGVVEVETWRPTHDIVKFSVRDNGPGIPEANLKRIFEPFFTTKPVGKGTGLGLSICYGIINTMGGDIVVESQVGEGTCFEVSLPINADKSTTEYTKSTSSTSL
jgi:two-component system NtrC family sensor kinase